MRTLVLFNFLFFIVTADRSLCHINDLTATREGEVVFGRARLKSVRSRLGERGDPFCIDLS